jgi:tetratricopeptide (TPR) repeat protein
MGGGDARVPAPPQRVNPSITEAPLPASKAKRLPEELSSNPGSSPMLMRLCTIVLLVLASLRVNAASVTGVIIANEAASSPAVNVAAGEQVNTTNRSGFTDLGSVGGAQNQMGGTRREYEESLKTYRELAKKEPETYLPHVAATLNNLGIFDSDKNQMNTARMEYEEALKIYSELAQKEPETYLPYVAATLNNLGILDRAENRLEEARKAFEEALTIYEDFAKQDPDQFSPLVEWMKNLLKHLPK